MQFDFGIVESADLLQLHHSQHFQPAPLNLWKFPRRSIVGFCQFLGFRVAGDFFFLGIKPDLRPQLGGDIPQVAGDY